MSRTPTRPIVVIGSSNTDMIVQVRRLPRPGETILGGEFLTAAGGKGANQAVAAARAGGRVTLVARLGSDASGDSSLAAFRRERIDVSHVVRDRKAPSGVALVFVARSGENSIAVASGANARLSPTDVRKAAQVIRSAAALVLQLESPLATVTAAAAIAAKARVPVILNPAPAQPLPASLLRLVSVLTPNETEAGQLTGIAVTDESTAAKAARALRARGVASVVITLGSAGAFLAHDATGGRRIPGFKVRAVDATGAGDVFNGALAVALAEGETLATSVRFANAAAALSVTTCGAQPSAPARRAIDALLRRP